MGEGEEGKGLGGFASEGEQEVKLRCPHLACSVKAAISRQSVLDDSDSMGHRKGAFQAVGLEEL